MLNIVIVAVGAGARQCYFGAKYMTAQPFSTLLVFYMRVMCKEALGEADFWYAVISGRPLQSTNSIMAN